MTFASRSGASRREKLKQFRGQARQGREGPTVLVPEQLVEPAWRMQWRRRAKMIGFSPKLQCDGILVRLPRYHHICLYRSSRQRVRVSYCRAIMMILVSACQHISYWRMFTLW